MTDKNFKIKSFAEQDDEATGGNPDVYEVNNILICFYTLLF